MKSLIYDQIMQSIFFCWYFRYLIFDSLSELIKELIMILHFILIDFQIFRLFFLLSFKIKIHWFVGSKKRNGMNNISKQSTEMELWLNLLQNFHANFFHLKIFRYKNVSRYLNFSAISDITEQQHAFLKVQ